MSIKLQLRRGLEADVPSLAVGEPGFCTNSYKLFIGSAAGNKGVAMLASPVFTGMVTLPGIRVPLGDVSDNLGVGVGALQTLSSGSQNTAVGAMAGLFLTEGTMNSLYGYVAGFGLTTGKGNAIFGAQALENGTATPCDYNSAFGHKALNKNVDGYANNAYGYMSMYKNVSGGRNMVYGIEALFENLTGSYNVAVGFNAGNKSVGDRNIFLGNMAGYYETGSDKLFVDNSDRASEADARIKALIYGVFDALTANQRLSINARLLVRECPNYANNTAALAGGLISGELYTVTGTDPLQVARVV